MVTFNGKEIPVITIPKGTLLFRAVKTSESDFVGADVKGRLCIPANYNVFFYASPFVVDGVHWFDDGFPNVDAYVTPHDLKIVSLLKPSPFTRGTRKDKNAFIESCSLQKACLKGREYDPCFRKEFLEQYPDIHGWTAVTRADSEEVKEAIRTKKIDDEFIPMVEDARGTKGPAEVALYPLKKRSTEDVYIDHPNEWQSTHQGEFNYKHVVTLPRGCKDRETFMRKRTKFDKTTGFYLLKDADVELAASAPQVPVATLPSVEEDIVRDQPSMLKRVEGCVASAPNSPEKPEIEGGLDEVPSEVSRGPWDLSSEAAKRTLDYIIGKLRHACYIMCVRDGKGELFKIEERSTPPSFEKALFGPRNRTLRNPPNRSKQWRVIQCLVREYKDDMASFSSEYAQFVHELPYALPNGAFILNLTDAVLLRKDQTEPWPAVTGTKGKTLESKFKGKFLPILGGSGNEEYWDVPMPNYDDVRIALGRDKDLAKPEYTQWDTKISKAVFRGAPTGCGYTPETNMRLKLATMRSDELDVGVISVKQNALKFDPEQGLGRLDVSSTLKPVERLTLEQQAKYKYIFHIDGNVAAYRLLKMMTLGSVILKVKGPYTTWVDHLLKDGEHYVSVEADLSNVYEVLDWCKNHDTECRMIAENARAFAEKALSREFINASFAKLVWDMASKRASAASDDMYVPLPLQDVFSMPKSNPVILVPYRERAEQKRGEQLDAFIDFMDKLGWKVLIIEQSDDGRKFNRGALLNVGVKHLMKDLHNEHFVFHDVDLLPEKSIEPYYDAFPTSPIHIAKVWTTKYDSPTFLGGVLSMSLKDIQTVNGFPNNFWGWGGEDDALRNRIKAKGLKVFQPTARGEGFVEQAHVDSRQKTEWKNMEKWENVEADKTTFETNGLNSVKYSVVGTEAYSPEIGKITVKLE